MFATLCKFFEDIAPDVCSFAIAVVLFKIFYWYTNRTKANLWRPLAKKVVSNFSASSASDTDRSGYQARNRSSTYATSRTTDRRAWKPSTSFESDCAVVRSTSPVGSPPLGEPVRYGSTSLRVEGYGIRRPQQVYQSVTRFKTVLEDWGTKQKTLEEGAMSHLQDAIAGLAPYDAAIVKALLDSKAAEGNGTRQQGRENARASRERDSTSGNRDSAQHWGHSSGAARSEHEQRLKGFEDSRDSLRANLLELASLDSDTVIMVRKISYIGFNSAEVLKAYFSKFGTVDRVMASHCLARSAAGAKNLRPAALGFLVMSKAEEAKAAIAAGEVQCIQGHNINVGAFKSHPIS